MHNKLPASFHAEPFSSVNSASLQIGSVKPLIGQIILYERPNFAGRSLTLTASAPDLRVFDFNDTAASARVISGKWALYENVRFVGARLDTSELGERPSIPNLQTSYSSVEFVFA